MSEKKGKVYLSISFIIGLISLCSVFSIAASYSIYNTDDFSIAYECSELIGQKLLSRVIYCVNVCIDAWIGNGGAYFARFAFTILNPLLGNGLPQLKIVMVMATAVGILGCAFFLYVFFAKACHYSVVVSLMLSFLGVWTFYNYFSWPEALFWFTGAMSYSFPLGLLMISMGMHIMGVTTRNKVWLIASYCLGFLAFGGNQSVAMAGVTWFLGIIICGWFLDRNNLKVLVASSIPFAVFAAFNILAPGNFVRASRYGSENPIKKIVVSFFYAMRTDVIQIEKLIKDTGFLVIVMLVFLVAFLKLKGTDIKSLTHGMVLLCTSLAVGFIAAAGYNSPYMPNRTLYVVDFFIVSGLLSLTASAGGVVRNFFDERSVAKSGMVISAAVGIIVVICCMSYRIEDGLVYKYARAIVVGEMESYYNDINAIYDYIENSTDENVVIDNMPEPIEGFVECWITEDPEWIGNTEAAGYYHKKSIRVEN